MLKLRDSSVSLFLSCVRGKMGWWRGGGGAGGWEVVEYDECENVFFWPGAVNFHFMQMSLVMSMQFIFGDD